MQDNHLYNTFRQVQKSRKRVPFGGVNRTKRQAFIKSLPKGITQAYWMSCTKDSGFANGKYIKGTSMKLCATLLYLVQNRAMLMQFQHNDDNDLTCKVCKTLSSLSILLYGTTRSCPLNGLMNLNLS